MGETLSLLTAEDLGTEREANISFRRAKQ